MARYVIEDTTLTALGDAIRKQLSQTGDVRRFIHEDLIWDSSAIHQYDFKDMFGSRRKISITITNPDELAPNARLDIVYATAAYWNNNKVLTAAEPSVVIIEDIDMTMHFTLQLTAVYTIHEDGTDVPISVDVVVESVDDNDENYIYTPNQMVDLINGILPGPSPAEMVFTGAMDYRFAYDSWNWYLDKYKDYLSTKNITNLDNVCNFASHLKSLPFDLNCDPNANCSLSDAFGGCEGLQEVPMINNLKVNSLDNAFARCRQIIYFPEGFAENWDWSFVNSQTSGYSCSAGDMLAGCWKLRKLPMAMFAGGNPVVNASYSIFRGLADGCASLDEIINMPNPHYNGTYTATGYSGLFRNTLNDTHRLKDFTFAEMNPVNWALQELDFSDGTGWCNDDYSHFISPDDDTREGAIHHDTEVTDDATYQALKDNPDWWTADVAYSRYNHDSAVRTINSLPSAIEYQTSSGKKANIIKFKGAAGEKTDGGAINTLTEEEIAVAAAKGWTVTLV